MKIDEYSQLVMTGVSWRHVLAALGGFNGYSGGTDQIVAALMAAPDTRERQDLAIVAENVILVANHSVGERYVAFDDIDSCEAPYIADENFNGGWKVAVPEVTKEIKFSSAKSGSVIYAEKMRDKSWTITGTFPMDGERYEGCYFQAFMASAAIPLAGPEQRAELERLRNAEDVKRQQLYDALEGSPIVEMDSFQGWDLLERNYATDQDMAEITAFLTRHGWEATQSVVYGYGDPVKVLSARISADEAALEKLAGYGWIEYPYGPQRWCDTRLSTIR